MTLAGVGIFVKFHIFHVSRLYRSILLRLRTVRVIKCISVIYTNCRCEGAKKIITLTAEKGENSMMKRIEHTGTFETKILAGMLELASLNGAL